ncbi:MAG TPA: hypothetical protein VFB24_03375 [Candidatus Binatia bacterium]|nr:hypothetical protein [Candidatus Binatia bacterium]
MKKILLIAVFMLATLIWAAAQQSGSTPGPNSGQATSPSSQAPGASQSQPSTPGSVDQGTGQSGSQSQAASAPVTEGCLGGSNPNYTLTDKAGTTYKLNIPQNADTSKLAQHVGESVNVAGNVNSGKAGNSSIDVQGIGKGMGKCPGSSSTGAQPPPKQ